MVVASSPLKPGRMPRRLNAPQQARVGTHGEDVVNTGVDTAPSRPRARGSAA